MFKEVPLTTVTDKRGQRRALVCGIGVNDAPYQTSYKVNDKVYLCPYFIRWTAMLTRCYSKRWLKANPSYVGCTVCKEWHSFMTFKTWMQSQKWEGLQLDKDLLSLDSKMYSPETCLFVSRQVNSLFNVRGNAQGNLPLGICLNKGKYEVGVSYGDAKRSFVGNYKTIPEAMDAYLKAKTEAVNLVIDKEPSFVVRKAIKKYLTYFTNKQLCLKAGY